MTTMGADLSLNCLPLIRWWKSEWLSRFCSHLCTHSGLLTANEAGTFKYLLTGSEMTCPSCDLGGSFQVNSQIDCSKVINVTPPPTNAAFWMQELQNSHVVFCWSLIAPLRKTIIFLKYNHHRDSSLTEVMTLLNKHDIHIFCWQSNSDYNQTGFAALLCSACTFMFSVHRPWQWTQLSLDHSGSITVERMGEYCWK